MALVIAEEEEEEEELPCIALPEHLPTQVRLRLLAEAVTTGFMVALVLFIQKKEPMKMLIS